MTNERACATGDVRPIKPVTDLENRHVKGEALVCKRYFDAHYSEVMELRIRQEKYEADLPKEPREALAEIHRILLNAQGDLEQAYAPKAALELIYNLSVHRVIDDCAELQKSLCWLATQGLDGLKEIEAATEKAQFIARQFAPSHEPFKA